MSVKLLFVHHFEFLSLKGGCTGSPESTLVKTHHCWKSHVAAHIVYANTKALASLCFSTFVARKCEKCKNEILTDLCTDQVQ